MTATQSIVRDGLFLTLSDGRKLGYAEYGDLEGKPLLYFHGGISSRIDISHAAKRAAERGIRIIAPDRPGIGLSARRPERSLLQWADDVEQLLAHLKISKIPLLGWSIGSAYVFPCAYKLPHLIERAATAGTCSPADNKEYIEQMGLQIDRMLLTYPESMRWFLKLCLLVFTRVPPAYLKSEVEKEIASSPADLALVKAMTIEEVTSSIRESLRDGGDGAIDDYYAYKRPWGFSPKEIETEIQMFHGDQDRIAPLSGAQRMAKAVPNAKLIIVPNTGHFVLENNLDLVLDSLFP